MTLSVFQAILYTRSVLKGRRVVARERNSRHTRRQLVGASYESLEQRALMAVIAIGEPIYETIGTVGDQDHFEFTLQSSTKLTFDTLAMVNGVNWTLQGPAGVAVAGRPLNSDLSSQWANYGQDRALDLMAGNYQLTFVGEGDSKSAYAFRLLKLSDATPLTPGSLTSASLSPASETDIYKFDVVAGNHFTIDTNSIQAGNASWNLLDPLGRPVESNNVGIDLTNKLLTMNGTYTLLVEGYHADEGPIDYEIGVSLVGNSVLPDLNVGVALTLGTIRTSTLSTSTETDRLTFTLTQPTRVYFDALKAEDGMQWTLEGPAGIEVQSRNFYEEWQFNNRSNVLDLIPGTYQFRINSASGATGTYSFRVLDLSTATDLAIGTILTGTLANTISGVQVASRTDVYKFNVNADDRFYFDSKTTDLQNANWRLLDPIGRTVPLVQGYLGNDLESAALTFTGTYTLLIEGYLADLGSVNYSFNVLNIPSAAPVAISPGAVVSGAITIPGQQARYSFTLPVPTHIYLDTLQTTGGLNWALNGPGGSVVNSQSLDNEWWNGAPNILLQAGSYELTIDGVGDTIGPYAFRLVDLSAAAQLPVDTLVSGTLATGRETVAYKFNVGANESYYFDSRSTSEANASWRVLDPIGRVVPSAVAGLGQDIEPAAFPLPGNYTLLVEGYLYDSAPINFAFKVHKVPAPIAQPLTLSQTTSGAISLAGEKDVYTFSIATAKSVYFDAISSAASLNWTLRGPSGDVVLNRSFENDYLNGDASIGLIPGSYFLTIDGVADTTGAYSFSLMDLTAATPLSLNTTITGSLPTGRESVAYSLNVASAKRFYFDSQTADSGSAYWRLLDPLGRSMSNTINSLGFDIESSAFTLLGTYTLLIEGYFYETQPINYSFKVHEVVDDVPTALVIGNSYSGSISVKGERNQYTFTLGASSRLYFDVLSSGSSLTWTLQGPAGIAVSNRFLDASNQINIYGQNSVLDLVAGNYDLTIDGSIESTGDYSFRMLNVNDSAINLPASTTVSGTLAPSDKTDVYSFAATRGQRFTFDTNSADPGSATWTLLDPLARPVPGVSNALGSDFTNVTLQMTGTYTLLVEGSSLNSPDTIIYSVAANLLGTGTVTNLNTGTAQTLGTIRNATIGVVNEIDTYRFTLAAPTTIYFDALVGDEAYWSLVGAEGLLVDQNSFTSDFWQGNGYALNLLAGTYQVKISGSVGDYAFRLLDLGSATPLTLEANTSGTLSNTINGSNVATRTDAYKLTAAAGERFYFESRTNSNVQSSGWRLLDPLGSPMPGLANGLNGDFESSALTMDGTYTLLIEGAFGATGTIPYSFAVHGIPADVTLPLTFGIVQSGSLSFFGRQQHYSFALAAETRVVFNGLPSPSGFGFSLSGPAGVVVQDLDFSAGYFDGSSNIFTLQPGEYVATIDGSGDAIGNYSFRLLNFADATSLTVGSNVSGSLSPASELDFYKFNANAGDSFYFDTNSLSTQNAFWQLVDPLGRIVPLATNTLNRDMEPDALTLSGTYTLLIQGYYYDTDTINYSFKVASIPGTVSVPLQIGTQTTGAIASFGETDQFTFTLTEDATLYFDGLSSTDIFLWSLLGPAGYQIQNAHIGADQSPDVLSLIPGSYTLIVDGFGAATGSYGFQLLDLATAAPIAFATTIVGSLSPAQEVDTYKFTAAAGDRLFFNSTSTDTQNAQWRLLDPFGRPVPGATTNLPRDIETGELGVTGTYTLLIEGYFYDTSSIAYSFRVDSIDVQPADTELSATTLAENEPVAFNIGLFITSDIDETSTQTYSLVAGDGAADNSSFTVAGHQLKSTASFDFESKNSYSIRVRTTDNIGLKFDRIYVIGVTDVNEAPTDIALSGGGIEENKPSGSTVGTFTTTDPDVSNSHTYSLVTGSGDTDNASFTIDAVGNLRTASSFNYEAKSSYAIRVRTTDQGSLSKEETFVVSVINVNEAPIPLADNFAVLEDVFLSVGDNGDLIDNDTDPENDALVLSAVNGNALSVGQSVTLASGAVLTVQANGQFIYDPRSAFNYLDSGVNASDSFEYSVTDGEFTSQATASITIQGVNDAPVATPQSISANEDTLIAIALAGTDVEGDSLTYSIASGPTKGFLTGTGSNLTYTPSLNANGADSFTFKVNDGALDSQIATISISVAPVNDAPTATGQSVSTNEDVPLSILLNGIDVDGDTLSYLMVSVPTLGTLSGTAPNLVYTPNLNVSGSDSFSYKVNDGEFSSEVVVVFIAIAPINDAPTGDPQSLSVDADGTLPVTLTGSDVDSGALTYSVLSGPTKGTLSGVSPNLLYTPGMFESGLDTFTFLVNDGQVNSATVTISITINQISYDFGDLANSFGTLLASNGPWHSIRGGLFLGSAVTSELNGRPSMNANLDTGDDGVILPSLIVPNLPAVAHVTASQSGRLDGFIDFNGDGAFDGSERITPASGAVLSAGSNAIDFLVPATAKAGSRGVRFRLSSVGGLAPLGPAHDGEVEDYKLTVRIPALGTPQLLDDPSNHGKKMLFIRGTSRSDTIAVNPVIGGYQVLLNGVASPVFNPTSRVVAFGLGGDDDIRFEGVLLPGYIDAGAGNDTVRGGNGNDLIYGRGGNDSIYGRLGDDTIYGGAGNDIINSETGIGYLFGEYGSDQLTGNGILVGGNGNDLLTGSGARNLLIGGLGADRITGANVNEGDILVSGPTLIDADIARLKLITAEWILDTDYAVRIANLDGTTAGGLNGSVFLNASTVLYENSIDTITNFGSTLSSRSDWVFMSARDRKVNASGVVVTIQPPATARMASNIASNEDAMYDMNGDDLVSPVDALIVINVLNQMRLGAKGAALLEPMLGDVNGDGAISPLDALLIINRLNQRIPPPAEFVEVEAAVDLDPGEEPDGSWVEGEGEGASQLDYASRVDAMFDAYEDLVRTSKRKNNFS